MTPDELDPRGLIKESYLIEGISAPECRSIFLDWALGVAQSADMQSYIKGLLEQYASLASDHPMTAVLQEGLETSPTTGQRRRGGRGARLGY